MIKFKQGSIGNIKANDGSYKDIVVKSAAPNTLRDSLIGGAIVMAGIAYLTVTAFKSGSKAFEKAELYTMRDCGVIDWDPKEVL